MPHAPIDSIPKHSETASFVTRLIIDVKLLIAGKEPSQPITPERLDEWSKIHLADIYNCKTDVRIKY
jgi:hypothetical protein